MRILKKKILVAGATALLSTSAFAGDINWSGFLSVVGGMTLDKETEYSTGFFGYGADYGNDFTFEQESSIGLQGQMAITDKLRATVQILARGGNQWDARTEWAYLSYNVSDEWTINAGRIRIPQYYFSDFLDVGYAYDWVRPPSEVYGGPTGITGITTNYSSYWGDIEVSNQTWYGAEVIDDPRFGAVPVEGFMGTAFSFGIGDLILRAAKAKTTVTLPGLGERGFDFQGIAAIWDIGNFKLKTEFVNTQVEGYDKVDVYYASVGYTFGDVTPYYTFTVDGETNFPRPDVIIKAYETNTLGVAWDFHPGARFKFEYLEREYTGDPNEGDDKTKLVAAAIDIVF